MARHQGTHGDNARAYDAGGRLKLPGRLVLPGERFDGGDVQVTEAHVSATSATAPRRWRRWSAAGLSEQATRAMMMLKEAVATGEPSREVIRETRTVVRNARRTSTGLRHLWREEA